MTSEAQHVKPITCQNAYKLMEADPATVLIDVRSNMEFLMIGHPRGAIHLSWMDEPDWEPNPNFAREVRELMLGQVICSAENGDCAPILLICRSGNRSLAAGKALIEAGFKNVYNIIEGFEGPRDDEHHRSTVAGWRFEGLPWEQC
jgi:rhodanese-related sulfurtransferase